MMSTIHIGTTQAAVTIPLDRRLRHSRLRPPHLLPISSSDPRLRDFRHAVTPGLPLMCALQHRRVHPWILPVALPGDGRWIRIDLISTSLRKKSTLVSDLSGG